MSKSWALEDAQTLVDKLPKKFTKPSSDALKPLEGGHKAKLVFKFTNDNPKAPDSENLWVEILLVEDDKKLLGQLEDEPQFIQDLKRGDIIEFEERHIIDTD